MFRLKAYLKPYLLLVLLAIGLLYVQANAELALPDYMSRIVNTGIQGNGIENAVPGAMRQTTLDRVLLLLPAADREAVLAAYRPVGPGTPEALAIAGDYPAAATEAVVVRNDLDRAALDALNPIMARALAAVAGIEQAAANPEAAAQMSQGLGLDLAALGGGQLPEGVTVFDALAAMPDAQRAQIGEAIAARTAAMGDTLVNQMGVAAVEAEYTALGVDVSGLAQAYILRIGLLMLAISLLAGACTIAVGFLASRTSSGVARDLRRAVFRKVESFSSTEFDKFSTASLITRSTNDVTQVQMVVGMSIRMMFYAPIIGVGGVIRAVDKATSMWWLIAVAVLALVGVLAVVFSIAMPKFRVIQDKIDRLNLVMREHLSGMMVIRAFNKQADEERRFDVANQDLTGISLFVARVMTVLMPVTMFIMSGLTLAVIWVGSHQIAESTMQVGDMMAFMQYAMQIMMAFMMMSFMFMMVPRAAVSGDRIADVLETGLAITDPPRPEPFPAPFEGSVEFRDVSFRYPNAPDDVLHGINFTAQPGETTALIGSTGSGKSTLVNLIPRFYDVTEGAVLVGGVDVRRVSQHDLRAQIGYVPQVATLFTGTIDSNLRYGDREAPAEVVTTAAEIAQATEFIEARPEGLAAEIAQGGANVSGGQKQRLSIARALVKEPAIFVFDDSFSALDYRTDAALRRALRRETADATVLIVTQRVATIRGADRIIVLDEGRVVGQGTHDELMDTCETYRDIAYSQLSKEELA